QPDLEADAPGRLALPRRGRDDHRCQRQLRTNRRGTRRRVPTASGDARRRRGEGVRPMRAIVVDDSRAMRLILKRIVGQIGFEVFEAEDGQAALDLLGTLDPLPNLALVDWNMPNMNGLEFVTAVRADARFRVLFHVMVTTESEQSQIVRALAAGA